MIVLGDLKPPAFVNEILGLGGTEQSQTTTIELDSDQHESQNKTIINQNISELDLVLAFIGASLIGVLVYAMMKNRYDPNK